MPNALTNETAWWRPRAGRKLNTLSTPELTAVAAGMDRALSEAQTDNPDTARLLETIKAELQSRGEPLETR